MMAEVTVTTTTTEKTLQAATAAELDAVMSDVNRRELPRSTIELVGQAAGDVTHGLGRQPLMLGVVILNIIGIGCAVYFLSLLINGQQRHLEQFAGPSDRTDQQDRRSAQSRI